MSTTYKGVGFNWLSTTGVTTFTGSFQLQSRDYSRKSDKYEGRNANGEIIGKAHYNKNETATVEYLVTSVTLNGSASVEMPQAGDDLVIADAAFGQIAGTWDVDESSAKSTNTQGLIVTVNLWRNPTVN